MDAEKTRLLVEEVWARSVLPTLQSYIAIPNKSPAFDAEWEAHGHMDRALDLIVDWCRKEAPANARIDVH